MADKVFYALYDDDDILADAAKVLVSKGVRVNDVFSPFPLQLDLKTKFNQNVHIFKSPNVIGTVPGLENPLMHRAGSLLFYMPVLQR